MKKSLWFLVGSLSFFLGFCSAPAARAEEPIRFDNVVRNDFFAGFSGNPEALKRAMDVTSKVLAASPNHAEAMVWHGSGLFFQSGDAFRKGETEKGRELWQKSLAMMDQAVTLQPDHVGVRIPRGAALMQASRFVPPDIQPELLKRAISDYQRAFDLQKDSFGSLSSHAKGELLIGLADGYDRTGEKEKSRALLEMLTRDLPDSVYGRNAAKWLSGETIAARQKGCLGCHTASNQ